ncbi:MULTISPECIES: FxSxx-COOH system tetratricopeptide repeat protein [Frankia]|nr:MULTISPECIES: FxSxx-COOH system tetratricopeptide repeat protein [Frankia]
MGTGDPVAGDTAGSPAAVDFFVSYTGVDQGWAEWVAWQLEAAGYTVRIQAWDFGAGAHFVTEMHQAAQTAARTVAVLSAAYVSSAFAEAEWQAAWATDPSGRDRKLLVFRVEDCDRPGLLAQTVSVDLFGVDRTAAASRLVAAVRGERGKPTAEPLFPGGPVRPARSASGVEPVFPGRLPAAWNVPGRNRLFTGRAAQLEQVRTGLGGGPVAVSALYGMGGVGKTQLAVEYAWRHAADYSLVWWVDAEQTTLLAEKIAALARPLGLPTGGPVPEVAAAVLAALGRRAGWLLVFDNADNPAALRRWLPAGPGHILITSRHPGWDPLAATVDVDLFPRGESVALLTRRLPDLNPTIADQLAEELGDLPLALAQAAAYLTHTRLDPAVYLHRFRARRQTFLGKGDDLLYAGRVDTCWSISLDRLRDETPAAVALLELCALLAPEPIPLTLLTDHAHLLDPPLAAVTAGADPTVDLDDTLAAAGDYSLARRLGDTLVVHRLVQTVIAGQLTADRHQTLTDTTGRLLDATLDPLSAEDPGSWPVWAALGPHLLHAHARLTGPTDPHQLRHHADGFCFHLYAHGDYPAAHTLATRLHQDTRDQCGPDHPATLTTAYTLAITLGALGDHEGARVLDEDTLARRRRILGDDHPNTLISAGNLAIRLADLGDVRGARVLDEDPLTRRRRVLGDDHPDTLTSAGNLAATLAALGDVRGARVLDEDPLTRRRRVLGDDHPHTLTSAHSLAVRLADTGELPAACDLGRVVVEGRRRMLGVDHPDTLDSAHNLAVYLADAGRVGQARVLLVDTAARLGRVLGEGHPSTQLTARVLAELPADPPVEG